MKPMEMMRADTAVHEPLYGSSLGGSYAHASSPLLSLPLPPLPPPRPPAPGPLGSAPGTKKRNLPTTTMARRYDSSTTTFSPEGRLHQVEYAIEAINNAGTCVGILASDGIVLASEKRVTSGLLAPTKVRSSPPPAPSPSPLPPPSQQPRPVPSSMPAAGGGG